MPNDNKKSDKSGGQPKAPDPKRPIMKVDAQAGRETFSDSTPEDRASKRFQFEVPKESRKGGKNDKPTRKK